MMRLGLLAISASLLLGCATSANKAPAVIQIQGLKIENKTMMWVSAARLMVPLTGGFVSCGNIAPGAMCSTGFPDTEYSGNPVEVTWSQGGQIHSTGEFKLLIPETMDIEKPAAVLVIITAPGVAGAALQQ